MINRRRKESMLPGPRSLPARSYGCYLSTHLVDEGKSKPFASLLPPLSSSLSNRDRVSRDDLSLLEQDQVDVLKSKGVAAAALDSTLTLEETLNVKNQIKDNKLKILYCAPERLENEGFHELIKSVKVSMLAVDESHWFVRPSLLRFARVRSG
jgi:hypothetical protein